MDVKIIDCSFLINRYGKKILQFEEIYDLLLPQIKQLHRSYSQGMIIDKQM